VSGVWDTMTTDRPWWDITLCMVVTLVCIYLFIGGVICALGGAWHLPASPLLSLGWIAIGLCLIAVGNSTHTYIWSDAHDAAADLFGDSVRWFTWAWPDASSRWRPMPERRG